MNSKPDSLQIEIVLEKLAKDSGQFPPEYLKHFSDISHEDLLVIEKKWIDIPEDNKISLLSELNKLMQEDSLLLCDDFGNFALKDANPAIRVKAIDLLTDCCEESLAEKLLSMHQNDISLDVQIASVKALGKFLLLGELDEISNDLFSRILESLLAQYQTGISDSLDQEILISIGYVSRKDISEEIQRAYLREETGWKYAAITAMGRSADPQWEQEILASIKSDEFQILNAAVKSAGELNLSRAYPELIELLAREERDTELDRELVFALAKVGGVEARSLIEVQLENAESEEEIKDIQAALDIIDFEDQMPDLDF